MNNWQGTSASRANYPAEVCGASILPRERAAILPSRRTDDARIYPRVDISGRNPSEIPNEKSRRAAPPDLIPRTFWPDSDGARASERARSVDRRSEFNTRRGRYRELLRGHNLSSGCIMHERFPLRSAKSTNNLSSSERDIVSTRRRQGGRERAYTKHIAPPGYIIHRRK